MPRRLLVLLAILTATSSPAHAADRRFVVDTNPFVLGQAMDWLDRDHVVWHEAAGRDEDADGQINVYRSKLNGSDKVCLTCGLAGPNQVPVVQPTARAFSIPKPTTRR